MQASEPQVGRMQDVKPLHGAERGPRCECCSRRASLVAFGGHSARRWFSKTRLICFTPGGRTLGVACWESHAGGHGTSFAGGKPPSNSCSCDHSLGNCREVSFFSSPNPCGLHVVCPLTNLCCTSAVCRASLWDSSAGGTQAHALPEQRPQLEG